MSCCVFFPSFFPSFFFVTNGPFFFRETVERERCSDLVHRLDAKKVESLLQRGGRRLTEKQTRVLEGRAHNLPLRVVVALSEHVRELVQVVRDAVQHEVVGRVGDNLAELQQVQSKVLLRLQLELDRGVLDGGNVGDARLACERLAARVRVEHAHDRVARQRAHLLLVEHVVAQPVLAQVAVLDGADADRVADVLELLLRERREVVAQLALLRQLREPLLLLRLPCERHLVRLRAPLLQQVRQRRRLARPRPVPLLVVAAHDAEPDVVHADLRAVVRVHAPTRVAGGAEDHVEVRLLAEVGHADDPLRLHHLRPVVHRGHVRRVVGEASVALRDDEGDGELRHADLPVLERAETLQLRGDGGVHLRLEGGGGRRLRELVEVLGARLGQRLPLALAAGDLQLAALSVAGEVGLAGGLQEHCVDLVLLALGADEVDREALLVVGDSGLFVGEVLPVDGHDELHSILHLCEAEVVQALQHGRDDGVVERLAHLLRVHVQLVVDARELAARDVADEPPRGEVRLVAALQLHDLLVRLLLEVGVVVEAGLRLLVEGRQVRHVRGRRQEVGANRLQVRDEHAELGAPVAHVVHAEHVVAAELHQAADGVADDRRPQVSDVHLLRDVRRGEVDENARPLHGRRLHALLHQRLHRLLHVAHAYVHVDEPDLRRLGRRDDAVAGHGGDDRLGDLPRRRLHGRLERAELLAQRHRVVALVVGTSLALRDQHLRKVSGQGREGLHDGAPEDAAELGLHVGVDAGRALELPAVTTHLTVLLPGCELGAVRQSHGTLPRVCVSVRVCACVRVLSHQ
eukprot:Rhum_TRINITY_DN14835_c7_g2::Rhum_TRINITY_DN14835_c7_g2_i1::g.123190::m.123190